MDLNCSKMFTRLKPSPLILADLSIGGLILGVPLAITGYFVVLGVTGRRRLRDVPAIADNS